VREFAGLVLVEGCANEVEKCARTVDELSPTLFNVVKVDECGINAFQSRDVASGMCMYRFALLSDDARKAGVDSVTSRYGYSIKGACRVWSVELRTSDIVVGMW
jgi:hypothetical protein